MAQISMGQAFPLVSNPGFYLERYAALAWDRSVAAFGKQVLISGAVRYYETQVQIFDSEKYPSDGRYVRGNHAGKRGFTNDVRGRTADGGLYRGSWWTRKAGTAAAAVPGTSNHGEGRAVDVKTSRSPGDPGHDLAVVWATWDDADRLEFLRVAKEHGWDDDEGRLVHEVWHLTYYPERDQHRGEQPPKIEEDGLMAGLPLERQEAVDRNVEQIEVVVRRHEQEDKERRVKDLEHAAAVARRQRATDAKVEELGAKLDSLILALQKELSK